MTKKFLPFFFLLLTGFSQAQTIWTDIAARDIPKPGVRRIVPAKYRTVQFNIPALQALLATAPPRDAAASQPIAFDLPMPDGARMRFFLWESSAMHPELQAKYPEIRCYTGISADDPGALLKCDLTPWGFHAMLLSDKTGTVYIDPYSPDDQQNHLVYYRKDFRSKAKRNFSCKTEHLLPEGPAGVEEIYKNGNNADFAAQGDCSRRRYRLALACSGEYAQLNGGTKPLALAAITTTLNRINGVYEKDLAVTMQLVANNDALIFLDAGADPYTNEDVYAMIDENLGVCNNLIGQNNYDIGHVFGGLDGGGLADLGVACGDYKANGVTSTSAPFGDPFDVDYAAHEFGHQFGANHTQNNACSRVAGSSMEPGSGSTIMGYAGICDPNVQTFSDPYFHAISLQEISSYIVTGPGNTCPLKTSTGNTSPEVSGGPFYTIPKSTPFVLTATGSDANGDALSFCWEQMDPAFAVMPPLASSTGGPLFRSYPPVASPARYFPRLEDLVANVNADWEELPDVARTLKFRITARDNNANFGCTDVDNVQLTVAANAGPFLVTSPNTATTWYVGANQTITWNVAGTTAAPVSCASVRILLSTDGGFTYPYVLVNSVPNTGSVSLEVPNIVSNKCRVKVESIGNVFFDISNENFKIEPAPVATFLLENLSGTQRVCAGNSAQFSFEVSSFLGYSTPVNLSLSNFPAGATITFSANPAIPGSAVTLSIANLSSAMAGDYNLAIKGVSGAVERTANIILTVLPGTPTAVASPVSPADGESGAAQSAILRWTDVLYASAYQVEIATSPAFAAGDMVSAQNSASAQFTTPLLQIGKVYYWRIRSDNECGTGVFSPAYAFQVGKLKCGQTVTSANVPVSIDINGEDTAVSTLDMPNDLIIADVDLNLEIEHSWVGDLEARLVSPSADTILLFDRPSFPADPFGCSQDDILATFDDAAAKTAVDFENTCNILPAIQGAYQSLQPLSKLQWKSAFGAWKLIVKDNYTEEDEGLIRAWSLSFCFPEAIPALSLLTNTPLTVVAGKSQNITPVYLKSSVSAAAAQVIFTLTALPQHGVLRLVGLPLSLGATFTQADIDGNKLAYENNGNAATSDFFHFEVQDQNNQSWLHGGVFNINVLQNTLSVSAKTDKSPSCAGGADGQVSATATGGTPPLQYRLNNGPLQSSNTFSGLNAGNYTVLATDANGFTAVANVVTLLDPAVITVGVTVVQYELTITADGGTGNLQYSLDGQNYQAGNVFADLPNGVYNVTVRDANGCTATAQAIVAVNTLIAGAEVSQNISCAGGNDGALSVNTGGGKAPFAYSLNGTDFQSGNTFAGLSAGVYTLVVRDSEGFTANTPAVVLTDPPALSATAVANLNTITASGSGGTGALQYSLNGTDFQTNGLFGGLANGDYTVTVRDANGCTASAAATVNVPPLVFTNIIPGLINCDGIVDQFVVSVSGGVPPYQYNLNGGDYQDSPVFENIAPGTYSFGARDAAGNTTETPPLVIAQPDPVLVQTSVVANDVTILAAGGSPPYTYFVNGVTQSNNLFENLPNGDYTAVVTGANGCTGTASFTVNYTPLSLTVSIVNNPICAGSATGAIELIITGGTPPYLCMINGGPCQNAGLSAGNYNVEITDALGESAQFMAVLSDPPGLVLTAIVLADTIIATASGGTGVLAYSLDGVNYQPSPEFADLPNGLYSVYVRDEYNCVTQIENVLVSVTSARETLAEWGARLLPNPNDGRFQLSLDQAPAGNLQADVFDATGRRLRSFVFEPASGKFSATLDLKDLPQGLYQLRLINGARAGALRVSILR